MTATDRVTWLTDRRNSIGGSDVAGILGRSPWASPWSVWADKVGLTPLDEDGTASMDLGRDLEPVIARWFEQRTGLLVFGGQTFVHHPDDPFHATLDGFVFEEGSLGPGDAVGVFESKYTADPPWDEVPEHYVLQCQWSMLCADLDHAWVATMHLPFGRPDFRVYEVERDVAALEAIAAYARGWWADHVVTGDPPEPDAHRATTSALAVAWLHPSPEPPVDVKPLADTIAELPRLKAERKVLDDEITAAENTIKSVLGKRTEGMIDGRLVVSWREQTRAAYEVAATTFRVLRLHPGRN